MKESPFISSLRFRGSNLQFLKEKSHECIICSPADTGKTVAACYKNVVICNQVPGCHAALVRKTYNSINDSVARTFDRVIQGLGIRKLGGTRADKYIFQNGSEIVLCGMDHPDRLLSSEWSHVQVCQAEELREGDWEIIASRVTGRGSVYKHPQIFGDCNPSHSRHWIRSRKQLTLLTGSVKDNPELYDDAGNPTPEGVRRMALAESMYTGVRRQRLLYGIWATAEGAVYDMFMPEQHVLVRPMSDAKEIFITIDEGYTNPAVILCVFEDSDGRMHVFREFYKTKQLQGTVVEQVVLWSKEFGNPLIACDEAAAGLIADLKSHGLRVQGAKGRTPESSGTHVIMDGIKAVQDRLKMQEDGRPRLTVDPSCVNTIQEFESYAFAKTASNDVLKDCPAKEFDHTMDAIRYLVALRMTAGGFASAGGFMTGGSEGGLTEDVFETEFIDFDAL